MNRWNETDSELAIISNGKGAGCVYTVIAILGGVLVLGSAPVFIMMLADLPESISGFGIACFVLLMGLILLVSGLTSGRKMNFQSAVRLDRQSQVLTFSKGEGSPEIRFGLGDVAFLEIALCFRQSGTSGSGRSQRYYQIFATKKDGARFWLDTFANPAEFQERALQLQRFTGLAIVDHSGMGLGQTATGVPTVRVPSGMPSPSPFVVETRTPQGIEFQLKKKTDALTRFLLVAVFTLFLGAPLAIFGQALAGMLAEPGVGSVVMAVFAGMFTLVFLAALAFIFLVLQLRDTVVVADRFRLTVRLRFRPAFIDRLFGRAIAVESTHLRAIRVNRLDQGHFWLSLSMDPLARNEPDFQQSTRGEILNKLLFNTGAFSRSGADQSIGDESIMGLWEIPGWIREGEGADYRDLLYLEQRLESILELTEQEIQAPE